MRLVCPNCAAAYDVPPTLLAGRRMIRCVRCGEEWVEGGGAPAEAPQDIEEPGTEPAPRVDSCVDVRVDPAAQPRRIQRDKTALRLAWMASLLVLALAIWGVVAWRTSVMHAWPASRRVYSTLGLAER